MRISRARIFVLWVAIFVASTGSLVSSNLHAWQRTIYFDRLLETDGLPDDYVNCIEQDSLGFMWFATTGGLAKYDGYEISNYRHDPDVPDSIASNHVLSILEDSDGSLWVDAGRRHPPERRRAAGDPGGRLGGAGAVAAIANNRPPWRAESVA